MSLWNKHSAPFWNIFLFNPKNFVRILGAYYPYCLRVGVGINSSTLILFIMYLFYYLVDHFQQLLIFFCTHDVNDNHLLDHFQQLLIFKHDVKDTNFLYVFADSIVHVWHLKMMIPLRLILMIQKEQWPEGTLEFSIGQSTFFLADDKIIEVNKTWAFLLFILLII